MPRIILPRIILSLEKDYIFCTCSYEEGCFDDYYEAENPIDIKKLPLSSELKEDLTYWHNTFLDSINDNFIIESNIMLMAIETLGSLLYIRVKEELKDKYYVVYSPYSSLFDEENYPIIVDKNKK